MDFNHDTGLTSSLLTIDTTIAPPLGGATGSLAIVGTGSLVVPVGTAAQRPANNAGQIRFNTDSTTLEFNTGTAWSALSTGGGTVSSITVTGSTGLTVAGSPITTTGTIALTLSTELQGLSGLAATGILARTGAGTFSPRTITGTAGNVTVTNGDGVAGSPTLNLATAGTAVTAQYVKITTDAFGRVTATTPVVAGDITPLVDATYVNVTGDTMSSAANLTFVGGGEVLGLPATPSSATAATSKAYVDGVAQGLDPKGSVRVATTASGTLATSFTNGSVHDGVTLATNDRLLVKNQAAPAENGIYTVNATGAPTRALDMDAWLEVPGAFLFVEEGTTQADTAWVCTSNQGGTLNTTAITFVQFGGAGTYTAGTGLTLTGTTFSITAPISIALGGTGLTTAPANGAIDIGNGTAFVRTTITQGTGVTVTNGAGSITIANSGVTSIAGTANQIAASAATGAVTLSLPAAVTLPGSLVVTTSATISGLTANAFLYSGTAGLLTTTAAPTNGQLLIGSTGAAPVAATLTAGTGVSIVNAAGSITINSTGVTSVAASGGTTGLTFTGSPITTTGTLTLGGTLAVASGGTGLTTAPANGQLLVGNGTGYAQATLSGGTGISIANGAGTITVNNTGVTSVGLTTPSIFTVSGSPVTTTGTLSFALNTQANNTVFAGPSTGGPLVPTFRTLTLADLQATALKLYTENPSAPTAPVATGANAQAFGSGAVASATGSSALGSGASAYLYGATTNASGAFATLGDAQAGNYVLRGITTTAAVTEIFLDGAAAKLVLPNNSLWTFSMLIAGRRTDATGGGAGYKVEGVIRKDASAASTTLVGAVSKSILGETNAAWDVTVTADTANGSLKVTVTGEAAKTIRWVATVMTTEVTN
jgi:hypothetical protein